MDDRFDRRELLLHLGDVLGAMRLLAGANRPYSPVAKLASQEPSLQTLPFLQQMSPLLRAKDFLERAASAYANWPRALLEADLDRVELASSVRRELFADDPQGWESYTGYIREKVSWFGLEPEQATNVSTPANEQDDDKSSTPANESDDDKNGTPATESDNDKSNPSDPATMKTGWPWKPIG